MKYYYYEVLPDGFDEIGSGEELLTTIAQGAYRIGAYPDGIVEKRRDNNGYITCVFHSQDDLIEMYTPDKHERKHEADCARFDYNRLNGE
jgi:hypothetical protein